MRGSRAWILIALCAFASSAYAQEALPPTTVGVAPSEELATVMARRISSHLGHPVRIKDLRYEILTSTFVGQQIAVGPKGDPLLKLGRVSVKPRFLSGGEGGGQVIEQLQVSGVTARIRSAWLERPVPRKLGRGVRILKGRILGDRITISTRGGASVILRNFKLTIADLNIPAGGKGQALALHGAVILEADSVDIEEITLKDVRIEGAFTKGKLKIAHLSGKIRMDPLKGSFSLKGALKLAGKRSGGLSLVGKADLRSDTADGPRLRGSVKLKGRSWGKVRMTVNLKSSGKIAPQSGSMKPAPRLQLRGKVGKRTLQGTLERWRLR